MVYPNQGSYSRLLMPSKVLKLVLSPGLFALELIRWDLRSSLRGPRIKLSGTLFGKPLKP